MSSVVHALRSPVGDITSLLTLLASSLKAIGILPSAYESYLVSHSLTEVSLPKHIPLIQRALLEHVVPYWEVPLRHSSNLSLLEQFFCPEDAPEVVLFAYSTILSTPITSFSVHLLQRLSVEYPLDTVYKAIFKEGYSVKQELVWEDYLRSLLSVPSKVANAFGAVHDEIPQVLERVTYFNNICIQCERLVAYISCQSVSDNTLPAITYLFSKLVHQGAMPAAPLGTCLQTSFFQTTMSSIRHNLEAANGKSYAATWCTILANIPSNLTLQSILQSLFASLPNHTDEQSHANWPSIKQNAQFLQGLLGTLCPGRTHLCDCTLGILVNKEWDEGIAWSLVCWISGTSSGGPVNNAAVQALLDAVLNFWSSSLHVRLSSLSRHQYLTSLLLITVSYVPSRILQSIISSTTFLSAVGCYISHTENAVRLCGMLVAEVLSELAGKLLKFNVWEGTDGAIVWARHIRESMRTRDIDPSDMANLMIHKDHIPSKTDVMDAPMLSIDTVDDSDDSLTGYASSPSSRSVSPSPSELATGQRVPYLNANFGTARAPIYLSQLVHLLRGYGSSQRDRDSAEAENIELALDSAEHLILRRKSYGSELAEENAITLVIAFLGLQDNYNLPQFNVKKQAALNALVASCPRLVAPCLIEEFFKSQYSVAQRFAALEALVFGAQELSLPSLPKEAVSPHSPAQPSLCPKSKSTRSQMFVGTIAQKENSELPKFKCTHREIQFEQLTEPHLTSSFTSLSTTLFISPLVSRFWLFIRDEQIREQRTATREGRQRHYSSGTAFLLNPAVLTQYLRTLAILVHHSRRSPEWLTTSAPDSLEIAVTVGTLPISSMELEPGHRVGDPSAITNWEQKEAVVLTAALELTLVILDGCLEIDHGQNIALEQTTLLENIHNWARAVFSSISRGVRFGGGSTQETSLLPVVTGVLLKADKITSRWQRSMVTLA